MIQVLCQKYGMGESGTFLIAMDRINHFYFKVILPENIVYGNTGYGYIRKFFDLFEGNNVPTIKKFNSFS